MKAVIEQKITSNDHQDVKPFLDDSFILENQTAKKLYHEYAKAMPIIDYHCHISPKDIAENRRFNNITEIWLEGDHYKWRAMRTNGVDEAFCTGNKTPEEKFNKWAETVPYTLRNPLYHWTHLELKQPFGIDKVLSPTTASEIYKECNTKLAQEHFTVQGLIKKANVEIICTTDDPIDDLRYHQQIKSSDFDVKVLPAWRPDNVMAVEHPKPFNAYIQRLSEVSGIEINSYQSLLDALQKRHNFFHENGCCLSDHGLNYISASDYTKAEIEEVFFIIRNGNTLTPSQIELFKSAILYDLALMDHAKGWVQQFHLGALRNNSTRMMRELGPDTGFDSIGDFSQAESLSRFLNKLDDTNSLTKTIIYNLNPSDNEVFGTMIGNFQDGSVAGKLQYGSGWWFLDQKEGMEKQINALSNLGLLSRFIGMLTDSRSFLSYSRHEYFRRILCNLFGKDIEAGLLPNDLEHVGKIIQDICYNNAKSYFNF
ncbi:glucuronate isomerase [Flammeovirga sp. EKP202]|uniref:glucuronate isomerase n=1 Tax=Flammeovirga sp. EKP202 TaxID=2770592 RepID=UPI00165F4446|nr:glucuronate isomerase [Flammeovirga sp. EKP202]MBD0400149.1 glucuronate isomerase [Flammeovirga sp. EKP202]